VEFRPEWVLIDTIITGIDFLKRGWLDTLHSYYESRPEELSIDLNVIPPIDLIDIGGTGVEFLDV
jgi:hypothetical protein